MFLLFFANLITFEFASSKAGGVTCNKNRRNLNEDVASEATEYGITKSALAKACWISAQSGWISPIDRTVANVGIGVEQLHEVSRARSDKQRQDPDAIMGKPART